jgi:integrase
MTDTKKGPPSGGLTPKHAGGRPRKGSLEFRGKTWHARLTVTVEGESLRKWFDLGTDNKAVARRKLAKLVAEVAKGQAPAPEQVRAIETANAYAEPWLAAREKRGLPSAENERRYWQHVWRPAIGHLSLAAVTSSHIQCVLDDAASGEIVGLRGGRYSRESISHLRATVLRVLEAAWRESIVAENVAKRTVVPDLDEERLPRAVLTDDEIGALVRHPHVDGELKLLVLLSRTIGGMRTGDLNRLQWTAFDPEFTTCTFVRRKTRKKKPAPVSLVVPASVRPFIKAWWHASSAPEGGPVFPARRGARAGQEKLSSKQSYALRLRANLRVAFGLDVWDVETGRFTPAPGRTLSPRERELLDGSSTVRPVDFHSTRRAYASALARAGTNEQTAMALTGHSDSKVHRLYLEAANIRALPAGAVPLLEESAASLVANDNRPKREAKPKPERKKPAETLSQPADFVTFSGAGEGI